MAAQPVIQSALPAVQTYDYSLFGPIEVRPLTKVRRIIARRLHASWVNIPMVAQFDEADISELEALRASLKPEAEAAGVRLTLLAFVVKACVLALKAYPEFNASLDADGKNLILKKYCHIGVATDTPNGLLVPVIKDADQKNLFEIAAAIGQLADKARAGWLAFSETEGGSFSITNLGQIGGTGFTPTINAPEVAVLGMARAARKLVDVDGNFVPRRILPLTLCYDHRVVDGAAAGRFMDFLRQQIASPAALTA